VKPGNKVPVGLIDNMWGCGCCEARGTGEKNVMLGGEERFSKNTDAEAKRQRDNLLDIGSYLGVGYAPSQDPAGPVIKMGERGMEDPDR